MQANDIPNDDDIALSLRNLRTVVAIADAGSLTAAGVRLGYAQATVSMHLAAAESALGVTLFRRHGRGVAPTDAGRSVVVHATKLFEAYAALRDDALHAAHHKLTLGAAESATSRYVIPFLKDYERDNPELELTVRVEPCLEMCNLLERGALDIAIVSEQRGITRFAKFAPLYDQEFVLIVPSRHWLAKQKHVGFRDLIGEQLMLGDERCGYRPFVEALLAQADIDVTLRTGIGNTSTILSSVAAGLGSSIVPRNMVDPAPTGIVAVRFRERPSVKIGLALRMDAPPSARRLATQISRTLVRYRQKTNT
jgi:LysR family transcriptional regulator, regulator of the ytmI operon